MNIVPYQNVFQKVIQCIRYVLPAGSIRSLIWLSYTLLIATTYCFHEPWRNEVDAWIVDRDATWTQWLYYFPSNGHPPLWYIIQLPFARFLALPVFVQGIIHVMISSCLAWLFLFRSPFSLWILIPFLFSEHMAFQMGVVARGYSLMLLMLAAAISLHPHRFQKPFLYCALLGFAFHTEIWAWPIAGLMMLYFIYDLWNHYRVQKTLPLSWKAYSHALITPVILGILALVIMEYPTITNPLFAIHSPDTNEFWKWLGNAFFPFKDFAFLIFPVSYQWLSQETVGVLLSSTRFVSCTIIFCAIIYMSSQARPLLILAAWFGLYGFVSTCIYVLYQHSALLMPLLMLTLWFYHNDRKSNMSVNALQSAILFAPLYVSLLYSVFVGALTINFDIRKNYSAGVDTGKYLLEHLDPTRPLIALDGHIPLAATAYLPGYSIYLACESRYGSFFLWDASYTPCFQFTNEELLKKTEAAIPDHKGLYVLATSKLSDSATTDLELVFQRRGWQESFWVYHYK